ncbi:hydroxyethylthiazole kinase [Siculibacillus lacustris]|uniref:Hydroxyethylthiazole kinase n=1 Tax=Siculibacillus lacustris TaxID=1549641 RepID=A0A4V2KTT4_9HYPH|nr:hydroxyethylthiazole kinase [Siculibacillus lacustris]TBW38660.1 hydroxyethylthiazole kinase [Siculibacillus lacustris]
MSDDGSPVPDAGLGARPLLTAAGVVAIVERLRARRPRVHVLTSPVALTFTANMLLAAGAEPSMTQSPEEIPDFVASADALLINLGMLDRVRRDAGLTAIEVAKEAGVPWILDPVKVEISTGRLAFARRLIEMEPALVHANRAEFRALAGTDAEDGAVRDHAVHDVTTLAVTGEVDIVTDGRRLIRIANGHPLMDRVTAMGCAATAVAAAFRAVEPDAVLAAAVALVVVGVAGEVAATTAKGPGSFAVDILDALHALDGQSLIERAKIR